MAVTTNRSQTLPYDWYTDPAVLRLEQDRLFARFWQYAGRADQVAEPGEFASAVVGTTPVILVRGREGQLRGFVNVCRHRGFILCEGDGKRETIQCPYHAWTYDLDGSLRTAPRAETEPGFDREALGLHPVSVAQLGPFIFANLSPDPIPFEEWLGDVPERLAEHGVDIGRLAFYQRFEVEEYEANWKVCAENFLECYHCAIAHPSLAKAIDVSQDAYRLTTGRWHSLQVGPPKNGGGGIYDAVGEVERGIFAFLFPNTVLNAMPGKLNLSIGPILPRGPERAFRFFDYYVGPDTDEEWLADFLVLETQVGVEDRGLVERVQRGLRNGVVRTGNLMPESEKLIAHFQNLVAEELGTS